MWFDGEDSDRERAAALCRLSDVGCLGNEGPLPLADSTGQRNSVCELSGRCYEAKSFSWTGVKLERDSIQVLLAIAR